MTTYFLWALVALADAKEPAYPQSIPVPAGTAAPAYTKLEVAARDGVKLTVHEWAPPKAVAGRPVVLFIHGIGMHGNPYGAIAAGFTAEGIPFVVPDLRGHGRSQGTRGQLAAPHVLRADLGAVIDLIGKRHPGAPVVLVGDSMGGILAADYAWRGERRLAGLALVVPAFGVNAAQVRLPKWNDVRQGRFTLGSTEKMGASTRSEGFLKARLADANALREVTPAYLLTIASLQADWPKAAPEIKQPLFVCVAGQDKVIDNAACRRVFDKAGTPAADKTWVELDGAFHTVCWDPATPRMVEVLVKWVRQRAP
jgi:alpha-beta hydrolase superfamily lysophospholipase